MASQFLKKQSNLGHGEPGVSGPHVVHVRRDLHDLRDRFRTSQNEDVGDAGVSVALYLLEQDIEILMRGLFLGRGLRLSVH